jgi:hypothetical protein
MPQIFTAPLPELLSVAAPKIDTTPKVRKKCGPGGLLLEFPDFNLRARREVFLESVPVQVLGEADSLISVEWEATAENSDGKLEGLISIAVTASALDLYYSDTLS